MNLKEIRTFATDFTVEELDQRARTMMAKESEEIIIDPIKSERFNSLVKAKTVRSLIDSGLTLREAIRELGRTMRKSIGDG